MSAWHFHNGSLHAYVDIRWRFHRSKRTKEMHYRKSLNKPAHTVQRTFMSVLRTPFFFPRRRKCRKFAETARFQNRTERTGTYALLLISIMLIYISTGKNGGGKANFSVIFHWLVDVPQTECVYYENKQSSARIGCLPCSLFIIDMCTRNVDCIYVGQDDLPVNTPPPSYGIKLNEKKTIKTHQKFNSL